MRWPGSRCTDVAAKPPSWLRFDAGGVAFAIDLGAVREIRRLPPSCPLPHVEPWVMGITNLRGRILALLDCAHALGLPRMQEVTKRSRMVVIESGGAGGDLEVGLAVDRVGGVTVGSEVLPPVDGLPPEMRRLCVGTLRLESGLAAVLNADLAAGLRGNVAVPV